MHPPRIVHGATRAALALLALLGTATPALPGDWAPGDVAIATGGQYQIRDREGNLKDTVDAGRGLATTGCIFDPNTGYLYTTNWWDNEVWVLNGRHPHNPVRDFPTHGAGQPQDAGNESLTIDLFGNLYISHSDGSADLHKSTLTGILLQEYNTEIELRGTDWIDLAIDQRTMWYSSEGRRVLRYDVVSGAQLPDFTLLPWPGTAFALRILPPGDGSGGLLVADDGEIKRLDAGGNVVQTYDIPGTQEWFALNLDPDGTSFWTADYSSGWYYRFDLRTGDKVFEKLAGPDDIQGLCVLSEIRAADPCGNGVQDPGEECDDGNRLRGDGCDELCRFEPDVCGSGGTPPEVNPTSLRVAKAGPRNPDLVVSFHTVLVPFVVEHVSVYRGSIAAFATPAHYDHAKAPGGCRLPGSPYVDVGAAPFRGTSYYYLVVHGCAGDPNDREGSYGYAWDGRLATQRPSAETLATDPCP